MGQVTTQPRTTDTPGPGTRGARREQRQDWTEGGLGDAWRLVAFLFAVALAIMLGWLIGERDTGSGAVTSASDEAAAISGEKDAMLAADAVDALSQGQDDVTLQDEKDQLLAAGSVAVGTVSSGDAVLQDEKIEIAGRWTGPAEPTATSPLTEQDEKELLLAG
ncbi:hypothetical protein [Salsipaludibacter albus]|uniref:hypothetical protein n=1 Tax=Salsipaludibacter albus TaxID=2849650 RepID=UPI001EE435F3|nr:hypothetical protein [Salsipaludibacter albus]MBY5163477.1 hypothetical protein [Salsipaludibacter albus]